MLLIIWHMIWVWKKAIPCPGSTLSSKETEAASLPTGRKYLSVVNLEGTLSSYSNLYFDNLAISKANPATSTFGKYNCYSGTSMAAPLYPVLSPFLPVLCHLIPPLPAASV